MQIYAETQYENSKLYRDKFNSTESNIFAQVNKQNIKKSSISSIYGFSENIISPVSICFFKSGGAQTLKLCFELNPSNTTL